MLPPIQKSALSNSVILHGKVPSMKSDSEFVLHVYQAGLTGQAGPECVFRAKQDEKGAIYLGS